MASRREDDYISKPRLVGTRNFSELSDSTGSDNDLEELKAPTSFMHNSSIRVKEIFQTVTRRKESSGFRSRFQRPHSRPIISSHALRASFRLLRTSPDSGRGIGNGRELSFR
jgi:hypothetical protein